MKLFYASVASMLMLIACAPLKTTPIIQPNSPNNTQLTSWQIVGAIAAKSHKKGFTASIDWHQQGPNQYLIYLYGPLGGGTISIERKNALITFKDGPRKITAPHAEELLERQTGIRLPVQNLYFWVRGIPAPESVQSASYDENHHLTSLRQSGYTIDYANYMIVNNRTLPGKIRLQGHDILMKLVIKHWSF